MNSALLFTRSARQLCGFKDLILVIRFLLVVRLQTKRRWILWQITNSRDARNFLLFFLRFPQSHVIQTLTIFHTEKSNKMQQCIKIYYSIFILSSTCFGRHTAHHQEPKTALAASGFAYVEGCWNCGCWTLSAIRIINFDTLLHLAGFFSMNCTVMHGSTNIKLTVFVAFGIKINTE
jgi:hypothetical protein